MTACSCCGGKVYKHGIRKRIAKTRWEEKWVNVWRFRCAACSKTFTRLPSFLLPYKHYVAPEIEGSLRHLYGGGMLSESPSGAEESTLWRWRKEYSHKMQEWAGLLESKVFKVFNRAPSFVKLLSHPLRRLEKALSWLPALPSQWVVMVKTLYWLLRSHPLCLG
ncbi:MAG: DUF6431 domain-containing protein [Dehalococcoidales bacterium]|nr:DUF6431 domain-containing protein [Dehalococcoidales bacterium]